jgi:CheY-like chemotaxis protein
MRSDALRQRVLVVDDESVIADTLMLILSQKGFEATAAYCGEKAVEAATAFKPDILIMDVFMEREGARALAVAATYVAQGLPRRRCADAGPPDHHLNSLIGWPWWNCAQRRHYQQFRLSSPRRHYGMIGSTQCSTVRSASTKKPSCSILSAPQPAVS